MVVDVICHHAPTHPFTTDIPPWTPGLAFLLVVVDGTRWTLRLHYRAPTTVYLRELNAWTTRYSARMNVTVVRLDPARSRDDTRRW